MKQLLSSILILILFTSISFSQDVKPRLMIGAGTSFNGTGDADGYAILNQVDLFLSKRFFISPALVFTNHSRTSLVGPYEPRFITTGINLTTNINYLFLNKPRHSIALGIGPLLRLQTTSEPSELFVSYNLTGQPNLSIEYDDPYQTLSLGYCISPSYYYHFSNRFFLGAKLVMQNDTQADIIWSRLLVFGIKL